MPGDKGDSRLPFDGVSYVTPLIELSSSARARRANPTHFAVPETGREPVVA